MESGSEKILYAKNPTHKQPPASTAKLVTAMVVIDNIDTSEVVMISKEASKLYCSAASLREGDRLYIRDLLYLLLVRSVNGAAVALAEAVSGSEEQFVQLMNKRASHIGAKDTKFVNPHGLPGGDQYITAYDLALVMKESLRYHLIKDIINTKTKTVSTIDGRNITVANTNKLLWSDGDLVGGKTGYTREARHCLAFAAEKGDSTLVAAVLGDSNRSSLWHSARNVLSRGYDISSNNTAPVIYYSKLDEQRINSASVHKLKKKHHKKRSLRVRKAINKDREITENGDMDATKTKESHAVVKNSKPNKQKPNIKLAKKKYKVKKNTIYGDNKITFRGEDGYV
ncbi:serine-type D-Ala-D-Ala carboxypeptidase [Candidatus Magnetobacterium bavaricum]|uniref:Serine-type D-Ala-D-Ala carboxypeptidase n=1 Tax=Candidatus Magnetobacterium bavaricum TaxID=29290 RepID=A0A0F3GJP6_9BACT|nr:serine-type D-Ala-D-Ala carboxypeptidase [Candidatus Magnetobacterium bavaricum]